MAYSMAGVRMARGLICIHKRRSCQLHFLSHGHDAAIVETHQRLEHVGHYNCEYSHAPCVYSMIIQRPHCALCVDYTKQRAKPSWQTALLGNALNHLTAVACTQNIKRCGAYSAGTENNHVKPQSHQHTSGEICTRSSRIPRSATYSTGILRTLEK
jgi:hypothetical protein